MSRFYIKFDGSDCPEDALDLPSLEEARDLAVIRLGEQLQKDPAFAYKRHWRVDVKDSAKRILLHVVVATVEAPPPINLASFHS